MSSAVTTTATSSRYRGSLAGRVTLLTTLAVAGSIALIAIGLYFAVRVQLQANMDESLLKRATAAAENPLLIRNTRTGETVPTWVLNASDIQVAEVSDHDSWSPTQKSFPRPGPPEVKVATREVPMMARTIATGDGDFRVVTVPISGSDTALMLAQSLEPQKAMYKRLGFVVLFFGAAGVVAAALAGWVVAAGGLRPVRRLTASVDRIATTEDLTPLPVEGDDEIARLATSFNRMLSTVAASRDRQRQLVADASHELRTPLTSLRTNVELLTQADASISGEQRADLLGDIRAQIEELTNLIGDLVELARDAPAEPTLETVDLSEVVDRALSRVRLRAPSVTFTEELTPWWVMADAGSLERAVTNLLDNAAKWSPESGTVHIGLHEGELTVDDEGPGIAEDDIPYIFDRFYRSTEARSMPGSGLGLAIVRQIAERTGGSVSAARSPHGGARMTLRLPGSASPRPVEPHTEVLNR
ncbi:HAMP domain-containing sensor histidine kinase [Nocardioides albus]|uniref:histidine kinase n=1 Tax=Nocardioides albus TaxID=1841 RepID=A0A7W5A1X1_9ACTN|nr:HAMP domain-containing sensor histidine kinase [Nocardioides albus]MBB3088142.1 two-component system sensor histidine kinase MprB [Nocardioides albus]GGU22770.1 two-component sensor histidine kinase [Nocardioides albus]